MAKYQIIEMKEVKESRFMRALNHDKSLFDLLLLKTTILGDTAFITTQRYFPKGTKPLKIGTEITITD